MLDFDEAQKRLSMAGGRPAETEDVALAQAAGRILARPVAAAVDLPPADNSAMDGYAIRLADFAPGYRFPIQQRCFAGQAPQALEPGNAIRLFTGSLMPGNADTVVMQEDCDEADDTVEIRQAPPQAGWHVRRRGEDVTAGRRLLDAGIVLGAAEIALLASQGCTQVPVYPKLNVGILTTGDELIAPGNPRRTEQIYNSNGPMLAALAQGMGAHVVHTLHALDTRESLERAFATLLADCDLVITVGGVSVGEKDLVKPTIEHLGGTLDLWRVCMKPGKPVALAHARGKPIVCLPGNPVSAFAVFTLLLSTLVRAMQGRGVLMPEVRYGKLLAARTLHETREEFLRVRCEPSPDGLDTLRPYAHQGSGVISSLPWADGLARIPANTKIDAGDPVAYYDFSHWLA